jgi:hypothetical protein
VAARAYWKGKTPRWVIAVRCLSCRRRGVIASGSSRGRPWRSSSSVCAVANAAAAASWHNERLLKGSPDLKCRPSAGSEEPAQIRSAGQVIADLLRN